MQPVVTDPIRTHTHENSGIRRIVTWMGRTIGESAKVQPSVEAGGLMVATLVFFPFVKSAAGVLFVINLGTYVVHITVNAIERNLSSGAAQTFNQLRQKLKEIKDKVPIALMAAIAVGIAIISWPCGLLTAVLITLIRGGAALPTEDPTKKIPDETNRFDHRPDESFV